MFTRFIETILALELDTGGVFFYEVVPAMYAYIDEKKVDVTDPNNIQAINNLGRYLMNNWQGNAYLCDDHLMHAFIRFSIDDIDPIVLTFIVNNLRGRGNLNRAETWYHEAKRLVEFAGKLQAANDKRLEVGNTEAQIIAHDLVNDWDEVYDDY